MKEIVAWLALSAVVILAASSRGQDQTADSNRVTHDYTEHDEHVTIVRTTTVDKTTTVHTFKPSYKCAIFIENHTNNVDNQKIQVLQDDLISAATDRGFNIIAREDAMNAVSAMGGPNAGDANGPGANLDAILSNNTSATHLAQNMGADYVLVCTITSYAPRKQSYHDAAQDIDLVSMNYRLHTTFRLLDVLDGGSESAGSADATITDRIDPRTGGMERENVIDDLLDADANDMAEMLSHDARSGKIPDAGVQASDVDFEVDATCANLTIPVVVRHDNGEYEVTASQYHPEVLGATVEIDGITTGSTEQHLKAKPGIHKILVRRDLFNDWARTVNIYNGEKLDAKMSMNDEGLREYVDLSRLFEHLKAHAILTDAEAKVLEGRARELSHSEIRVDIGDRGHADVNVRDPGGDATVHAAGTGTASSTTQP